MKKNLVLISCVLSLFLLLSGCKDDKPCPPAKPCPPGVECPPPKPCLPCPPAKPCEKVGVNIVGVMGEITAAVKAPEIGRAHV
jgi:hypothetical protein